MGTMTAVKAPAPAVPAKPPCLTIGQLRRLIDRLPADSLVRVGVRDRRRFNTLIGELPVRGGAAFAGVIAPTLILDVDGLT